MTTKTIRTRVFKNEGTPNEDRIELRYDVPQFESFDEMCNTVQPEKLLELINRALVNTGRVHVIANHCANILDAERIARIAIERMLTDTEESNVIKRYI